MSISKFESMLKTNNVYFFDATEFEEIIQHYLNISKMSLAKKAIALGLEQHPASIPLKLLKVEVFVFEDNLTEAIALLSEVEAISPHNDEVFIQKATICSKKSKHEEAVVFLKQSLEFTQDPVDVWAMIGMEYLYMEDYDNACQNFAKCLDVDFEDYSSLYNIIYCFEIQEDYEGAIKYLSAFVDRNPYSEVAWHQLGRQYFELKKYQEALKAFDYAILIDESFIGGYIEKAKTLEKLDKHEDAIANYLITTELDDPTAFVYVRIGECYKRLQVLETAIKYYKKAVHEDPFLDTGWVLLSDIYYEIDDYEKAIYYINKAIEIDELNSSFWRKYADISIKLDFYDEAVMAFHRCLDLGDDVIGIYVSIVDVLVFIGHYEEALKMLKKAKTNYKGFAEIEYRLCGLLYVLDKKEHSWKHLKNGLAIDFEYHNIIKDLFPVVFESEEIQKIISDYKRVLG